MFASHEKRLPETKGEAAEFGLAGILLEPRHDIFFPQWFAGPRGVAQTLLDPRLGCR